MKSYISRIIIYNRAPFDRLDLSFEENGISVLTGVNGQGKTTIESYIVDSWYELIRQHFAFEFKGFEETYYRLATRMYVIDLAKPSLVYIQYKLGGETVDYLNLEGNLSQIQYNEIVDIPNKKIDFSNFKNDLDKAQRVKIVSSNIKEDKIHEWLNTNVVTSFPSFRYEMPYYLTEHFKNEYKFKKDSNLSGYLINPLEVVTGIDGVTNWLMDLVLDLELYDNARKSTETILWQNISTILSAALVSKLKGDKARFGLGRRNSGAARISVVKLSDDTQFYPSIFGMSSGELSILSMFVEILRQADNLSTNIKLEDIQGIVLIDEIDKHLHIKLQKEVLPAMLELFPNVQFIISTHSPFLTMGLAENVKTLQRSKIVDLDQGGMETEPKSMEIYQEVYNMMIGENNNFKQLYDDLKTQLKVDSKPLVITEGKTDAKHIKNAIKKLGITDVDVEFYEIGTQDWGDSQLKIMMEQLAKLENKRKIIGIFDRDDKDIIKFTSAATCTYRSLRPSSNVYIFCIPLVNEAEYGSKISIEHYYHKKDLHKVYGGKRLFLGEEFLINMNSRDGKYQTRAKKLPRKIEVNGVIDEAVYNYSDVEQTTSIALSKNDFADLVCGNTDFAADFDFSNFNQIIDVIREIVKI